MHIGVRGGRITLNGYDARFVLRFTCYVRSTLNYIYARFMCLHLTPLTPWPPFEGVSKVQQVITVNGSDIVDNFVKKEGDASPSQTIKFSNLRHAHTIIKGSV